MVVAVPKVAQVAIAACGEYCSLGEVGAMSTILQMPVGVNEWHKLRSGRFFFVDKTALLRDLFLMGDKLFLTRPRRMGKTLLCDTLCEWFTHGSKSFAGLGIDGKLYEEGGYPVINLSFYGLGDEPDAASFEASMCERLIDAYGAAGFPVENCYGITSFGLLYLHLNSLARARGKELVFLIDEWDYPISSSLNKPELCVSFQRVLKKLYSWLRVQRNLRFLLVTGIMRYREISLFTGQDIQDISMEPAVAGLLGYTQADLHGEIFAPYVRDAAQRMGLTPSALLDKLECYYDGFCFDEDASVNVYCPLSINKFFSALVLGPEYVPKFESYWMNSAGASAALVSYLRGHQLPPQKIMELSDQDDLIMPNQSLMEISYLQNVSFEQILVLSGYFSIKSITADTKDKIPSSRKYHCAITNQEVKEKFLPVLLRYLVNFQDEEVSTLALALDQIKQALQKGDMAQLSLCFNKILCFVRYDAYKAMESRDSKGNDSAQNHGKDKAQDQGKPQEPVAQDQGEPQGQEAKDQVKAQAQNQVINPEPEAFYRSMLKLALCSDSIFTEDEVANNLGRSDLTAKTHDHRYIFELKRLNSDTKEAINKRLNDGESQILTRKYGNNSEQPSLPQTMVVLVISDTYRQICAWRSFKVQRTDLTLTVLERHDEPVDMSPQAFERQQGLIAPQEQSLSE